MLLVLTIMGLYFGRRVELARQQMAVVERLTSLEVHCIPEPESAMETDDTESPVEESPVEEPPIPSPPAKQDGAAEPVFDPFKVNVPSLNTNRFVSLNPREVEHNRWHFTGITGHSFPVYADVGILYDLPIHKKLESKVVEAHVETATRTRSSSLLNAFLGDQFGFHLRNRATAVSVWHETAVSEDANSELFHELRKLPHLKAVVRTRYCRTCIINFDEEGARQDQRFADRIRRELPHVVLCECVYCSNVVGQSNPETNQLPRKLAGQQQLRFNRGRVDTNL